MKAPLLLLILLFSTTTLAIEERYRPEPTETTTATALKQLPDLIVTQILLPDEMPIATTITGIDVEIANIGKGAADGYIKVDISIDSPELPSCKVSTPLGGGFGSPFLSQSGRALRYIKILPGEKIKVSSFIEQLGEGWPYACQRPLTQNFTIIAEINPKGQASAQGSLKPRGRILETDSTNNILQKTVSIVRKPKISEYELTLKPGETMFTIPVDDKISVHAFRQLTSCEVYEYKGEEEAHGSDKRLDLSKAELVKIEDNIEAGRIYIASCDYASTVTFTGSDLEPFNKRLNPNTLHAVPTRAGMRGLRVYEIFEGCSNPHGPGHDTEFFAYISGRRNKAGQMSPEKVVAYTPVSPGIVYLVKCGGSYGGVWDPTQAKPIKGAPVYIGQGYHPFRPRAMGTAPRRLSRAGGGQFTGYTYQYKAQNVYKGIGASY
ncbi:hypothetical protein HY486_01250 [Candidatus Woesearchaeota archaeon]|nr:hypothetical protein [Candidatus Woesearchaeota archaeon]